MTTKRSEFHEPEKGNAAWKKLTEEDQAWGKGRKKCPVCGYKHIKTKE